MITPGPGASEEKLFGNFVKGCTMTGQITDPVYPISSREPHNHPTKNKLPLN